MNDRPDGIIITISQEMLKEKGTRTWLKNFFDTMSKDDWTYWMRLGTVPKHEVMYVYLLISGKIRYRANFVMYEHKKDMTFSDGRQMSAKAWVVLCGPLVKPHDPVTMKGFRGFRYTQILF